MKDENMECSELEKEVQELRRQLEQANRNAEYYKSQAAKEKQRAEKEYQKRREMYRFVGDVIGVPNKAASPTDKLILIEIYRAMKNTPLHELKDGRVKMFASWLSERTGMEVQAVRHSIHRLANLDIIDADLKQTFTSKQTSGNGAPVEIIIWYLGLYDDTIERLLHAMEVEPRKPGRPPMWCPHCAKEVTPVIRRKGHERQVCPGCERTLIECDFIETNIRGKVVRQKFNVQDHVKERENRCVRISADVDFPTELDDLP